MTTIRKLILTLCLSLVSMAGYAQASIDKIVETLENDKNVQEVMYTEHRDPSTHKLIKSSRLIQFSNEKILNKLIAAFKKERENAISYQASKNGKNSVYSIRFEDDKGNTAKYDLYQGYDSRWVLSISIINKYPKGKKRVTHTTDATIIRNRAITNGNNPAIIEPGDETDELMALDRNGFQICDDSSGVKIAYESNDSDNCNKTYIVYSSSSSSSKSSSKRASRASRCR